MIKPSTIKPSTIKPWIFEFLYALADHGGAWSGRFHHASRMGLAVSAGLGSGAIGDVGSMRRGSGAAGARPGSSSQHAPTCLGPAENVGGACSEQITMAYGQRG